MISDWVHVVASIVFVVAFLLVLEGWVRRSLNDWRKAKNLLRLAQEKGKLLRAGETLPLSDLPLPTAIRLSSVNVEERWVSGTPIVRLPKGAKYLKLVALGSNWLRFYVEYELDGKFFAPTWNFGNIKLQEFWDIEPESPEVEV